MPRELVTKSNSLIKASYSLSLVEQRLVLLAITQAKDTITERTELVISAQHYAEVFGVDLTTSYKALKSGADNLFERQFSYEEEELLDKHGNPKVVKSRWVSQVAYKDSEGYVSLKFAPAVIPLTKKLRENFTVYDLRKTNKLKSSYSYRLYEFLSSWKNAGQTPLCSFADLKRNLGMESDRVVRIDNFKRILDKSLLDINATTNLSARYEQKKRGRTVVGFVFYISDSTVAALPSTPIVRLNADQRYKYAEALVSAMSSDREINQRLCRFPESQISYEALKQALRKTLANQEMATEFYPLLKKVGYKPRRRIPRDEDGKPIIEDTISGDFDF